MNKLLGFSRLLFLSVAVLSAAACQNMTPSPAATASAVQDIQDQQAAWLKAFNAKDAAGMAALYTDDARLFPPNAPTSAGDIAIGNFWRAQLAQTAASMLRSTPETAVTGDYAYASGVYTLLDAKGATLDQGKYLEIWKQDGAKWKLYRDMYSSDQPAQAAATAAPASTTH